MAPTRSPESQGKRVLLIEDHTIFRQALALTLERELGVRVVAQAASFDEALDKASEGFDIAVVDLGIRDGDGAELVAVLRRANRRASILALTRRHQRERHARAFENGADAVVRKSASMREIISATRNL
jgi:DNA-binding NarL/FixJ family response regulator